MKRRVKKILMGILLPCCLFLKGCGDFHKGTEGERGQDKEEIVLWTYYETKNQKESMDELVKGFNESQDKYNMTWEYHGPVTEFNKGLAIGITQNQLPDMVILDNPDIPYYIELDKLEDITEELSEIEGWEEYFASAKESVEYEGRYYGLPFCCNNVALIYNKDILEEEKVSVPGTWEELQAAAEKLTTDGRYGFAMSAIDGEQGAFQMGAFILSAGDSLDQAGGEGTLKAFRLIGDMAERGVMSRDCVNWSQNDVARVFIQGKCAIMENGPWVFPALDESGINYGVAAFPRGEKDTGLLGGEDIAVIKGKNVNGSIAFLKYYSQTSVMLNANLMANSLPPRQDVAEWSLKVNPKYGVILSQMENCISRAKCGNWRELSGQISQGAFRVITGEKSPGEVCREIRELEKGEE